MTETENPQAEPPRDNSTNGEDPKTSVATVTVGGVVFTLHRGILATFNGVGAMPAHDILQAYNSLSTVDRSNAEMKRIVQGHVQLAWYRDIKGEEPPEKVLNAYKAMLEAPASSTSQGGDGMASGTATRKTRAKTDKKADKEPRVTAASIIRAGLKRGFSDEVILRQVKEQVSTSNADERHVAYYRKKMVDAGEIKAKAEKSTKKKAKADASDE